MTLEDFTEFADEGDKSASSGRDDDPSTAVGDADADADAAPDRSADEPDSDADSGSFAAYDVEPAGDDRGLGVVSVSQGLRVAEEDDETTLKAFVTTGNREAVRLGTYLLVPYPDGERLFCRITGLEYAQEFQSDDATEIHARRQMRRDDFTERDYKFMAELEPMSVIYGDGDDMKRRMTDRVPKPGAIVEEAADDAEIKTGLKIPDEGVFLGHL
ncbi:AAA family ATPase, partial [Halorubrum sp. SD626R]